jgi:hypothetical protein
MMRSQRASERLTFWREMILVIEGEAWPTAAADGVASQAHGQRTRKANAQPECGCALVGRALLIHTPPL